METVVSPYLKAVKNIKKDINNIAVKIIKDHKEEILDFIRDYQLGLGLDSFGKDLVHPSKKNNSSRVPLYEPSTENYWSKKNPIPRTPKTTNKRYSFDWTGKTLDNLFFKTFKESEFTIFSKATKAKELEIIYGTKLFDLTDKHNTYINEEIILPKLGEYIMNELFK